MTVGDFRWHFAFFGLLSLSHCTIFPPSGPTGHPWLQTTAESKLSLSEDRKITENDPDTTLLGYSYSPHLQNIKQTFNTHPKHTCTSLSLPQKNITGKYFGEKNKNKKTPFNDSLVLVLVPDSGKVRVVSAGQQRIQLHDQVFQFLQLVACIELKGRSLENNESLSVIHNTFAIQDPFPLSNLLCPLSTR